LINSSSVTVLSIVPLVVSVPALNSDPIFCDLLKQATCCG
jgi:hypothetical protein